MAKCHKPHPATASPSLPALCAKKESSMNKIIRISSIAILFTSLQVFAGSWGVGSFENDGAADWAYELEQSKSALYLLSVFNSIPSKGYIEVDSCSVAIAAADVAAALKDGKASNLPKSVAGWVEANKKGYKSILASKALESIAFCKNIKRSELAQLWQETSPQSWLEQVSNIEVRLK